MLILPLDKGQTLNFGLMSTTRSLNKWGLLLNSKDLMYILEQQSFVNYFQPILNLKTNKIFGYEVLIRGIKSDSSIMAPTEMFKLAKENDLLFNLDRQARENAITNSARMGISDKIFINFIPTAIYDPKNCLESTSSLIEKLNLNPEQIVFEVVETERIDDYNHLKNILNYYRKKGFSIALDDVGSGYNSIDTITELYPEYIKVDMGIIRDINLKADKQKKFNDISECCQKNNIILLAEGIETEDELDYVSKNGAQLAQGYYLGRPSSQI